MARTTISIPDHLKAQMDQLSGQNWSGIAQEAFQRVVDRATKLEKVAEGSDMKAAVARLRQSKEIFMKEFAERERSDGIAHGAKWAKTRADYSELASIAQHVRLNSVASVGREFGPNSLVGYGIRNEDEFIAERFSAAEISEEEFIESLGLELVYEYSEDFWVGFVEGAMEVWNKISEEI